MKAAKTIKVDGKTYTVNPFTADYGYDFFEEFVVLFGPSVAKLIAGGKNFKPGVALSEQEVDMEFLVGSMTELLIAFKGKPGTLQAFMRKVLENTLVETTSQSVCRDFETRFMGEYLHGIKLTAVSFKEQYADFLGGFGGLAKVLAVKLG